MADQKEAKPRQYNISTEIKLDLSSKEGEAKAIEALRGVAPEDGQVTVAPRVGRAMATTPKQALTNLAGIVDLDGDYDVTAASSVTRFEKVKSVTKPTVSIG